MAEPNQLPPVNDATDSGVREKLSSLPPAARAQKVWADASENIAFMLLASFFFHAGMIDKYWWVTIGTGCSVGATAARVLGAKRAGMLSNGGALLMLGAKPILHAIGAGMVGGTRYMLVFIVIAFGLGCGLDQRVEDARAHVKYAGEALAHLRAHLDVECVQPPTAPEWCPPLIDDFNRIDAAYTALNGAMP